MFIILKRAIWGLKMNAMRKRYNERLWLDRGLSMNEISSLVASTRATGREFYTSPHEIQRTVYSASVAAAAECHHLVVLFQDDVLVVVEVEQADGVELVGYAARRVDRR